MPENVRYHAGHTWALAESRELVRVGMDDFASKLIGKIESITLPQRGRWVRQGQKIWTIFRDGKSVDMVSPIEGTITDVNEAVAKNPELARKDPYGEGWLVTVQAPDSKLNFRNLLSGTLARLWTEDSALRLRSRMPALGGRTCPGRRCGRGRSDRAYARTRTGPSDERILPVVTQARSHPRPAS